MNWQELSVNSHYQTAVAVQHALQSGGNIQEAGYGITELIEALSRSEKRALKNQLIRLMKIVLGFRSASMRKHTEFAVE